MPALEEGGGLSAILVASDRQRSKALFEVQVRTIIGIFERVAHNEVRRMHGMYDTDVGDYVIHNS